MGKKMKRLKLLLRKSKASAVPAVVVPEVMPEVVEESVMIMEEPAMEMDESKEEAELAEEAEEVQSSKSKRRTRRVRNSISE